MSIALPYGSRRPNRWQRFMASPLSRSLMIGISFAILLNYGIQSGRDLAHMLGAAMSRSGPINGNTPGKVELAEPVTTPENVDPVVRFLETRVGHLLFSMNDSNTCRRVLFDNRTGEATDAAPVQCGLLSEAQQNAQRQEQARERTQQVLKSFRR